MNLIDILNINEQTPNPLGMESTAHRTQIVESAISLLKDGINSDNDRKKDEAINAIPDSFNWIDLEVLKMEWDELYVKSIYNTKEMTLIKLDVCASCLSPDIIIADCICTYQKNYETIKLEFEKCECCENIQSTPAKTEFNKSKIDFK